MKYRHRVLGLLAVLSVITYLDRVCIAVAGPRMQDSLGISPQVTFGYLVGYFGNYNAPLVPMVALLCVGAWLWLRIDPTVQLIEENDYLMALGVN